MDELTDLSDRRVAEASALAGLRFDADGLIPVVAQDVGTGRVLMVAWANREALEATLKTGTVHFWSRSRGELWMKGETSGNTLTLTGLHADCDGDTLLALVRPAGPACHTGDTTCFGAGTDPATDDVLPAVWATLVDRSRQRPEGSYTVRLLDDPNLRVKKLGEETAELIQALVQDDAPRATEEAADLVYHALAALLAAGATLDDLLGELERRRG
ncbi:MAG: bifunctional phosphoribosyl-AMP cyclohydrolase/phosphoribosyl-ATP diphosphatase HisIE [Gemmatimonadetes bacterium]|nr:bifunctional phosphoribosyl-AMP cyclohydrolase/phosphoribosyl-ATP diphosphatase HisIE [Gemmatimonadota bacterium]NNK63868.1 bifunctional phosphoribosyl-AMP cyclohydrolase/phosphoribosyl-ATP diphosphatase HisIE [Gemmatimonadota bacterium]